MRIGDTWFRFARYGGRAWGGGVSIGGGWTYRYWRLAKGGTYWWRIYWQGIGSWFFGWRKGHGGTEGALMVDIGPISLRVRG